jgi:hypothetical protein
VGPTAFDRRQHAHHRHQHALRNLTIRFGVRNVRAPLTISRNLTTTATCFNDSLKASAAPERTVSTWSTSASFGYSFTLGKKTVTSSGGVQIMGSPAGLTVNPTGAQTTPRYRLNLSVNINNLWNQPF